MQRSIGLIPGAAYVCSFKGCAVRFLGSFDPGDGTVLLHFRDLRDNGTFFRHADEAGQFHPLA